MGYDLVKVGEMLEGRYRIIRPIADGGMGTVFLAEHSLIKRKVAIKILHAELVEDATMIRRFMNEALAAGTLGHPNIVESTDMGFTKGDLPYIVFEYLEGTPLANEILRVTQMPIGRAVKIAHQIASALDAAHGADIIHRDLKSDNVFLVDRGSVQDHVKVLDFGISRFLAQGDQTVAGGNLLGTPEFMAPEQVLTPDSIDGRVDIYALGCVLYEMLTGVVPFALELQRGRFPSVEEAHALLDRIINDPPPPITRADVPRALTTLLFDKLLAKVPKWRFQTMKEVQAALEAVARAQPHPITIPPILVPKPELPVPSVTPQPAHGGEEPEMADLFDQTVSRAQLSSSEIEREVKALGERWSLDAGDLRLDVDSPQMVKLGEVISGIAAIADEMEHHPMLAVEIPHLRMTLATPMTTLDLVFAARVEAWLRDNGW